MSQFSFVDRFGVALLFIACSSEGPGGTPAAVAGASGAASTAGSSVSGAGSPAAAGADGLGFAGATSLGGGGAAAGSGGSVITVAGTSTGGGGGQAGGGTGGNFPVDPGTEGDGNITISPPYPRSPDLGDKGAPAGQTFQFDFTSAIYPGERRVTVVIPAQYVDGTEAPFMIGTDGLNGVLREAARNLAVHPDPERRIPPLVLIGVTPGSERSREYDTVSDQFWKYITTEIIPAVLAEPPIKNAYPNLKLTDNPSGRGAYGCSSGAPAVMGMAWFGDFTRLLTYSGTFVALRRSEMYPNGAWDYAGMIEREPIKPALRMFLHVSENDNENSGSMGSWKTANENLAAALKAKGYHYRFVYSEESNHCDGAVIAHTLPDALVWLWRGYQPD
jgi:iron(III)-enterobactin esterase